MIEDDKPSPGGRSAPLAAASMAAGRGPLGSASVSVVVPAWRAAGTIARTLASVAAQTVPPLEAIVVDDGSDDGTSDAAEACRPLMGAVALVVVRQDNAGAGGARNRAIELAHGELVAFLDADDEWLPDKLERSLEKFAADPGLDFVSHDVVAVAEDGGETIRDTARHFRGDPLVALFKRGFVGTSTVVARRAAVVAAGGFEPALRAAQDHDLWLRLAARGRFLTFPGALMRYHPTPAGITGNIERRRACELAVMARNASALKGRGPVLPTLWTRALIVQYEAIAAWRGRRRALRAAGEVLRTPMVLLAATAMAGGRMTERLGTAAVLAWMAAVMGAYYTTNAAYYAEKLGAFGKFLFGG
jgi:glycosyltransferase involved in cell wall biosynthesis